MSFISESLYLSLSVFYLSLSHILFYLRKSLSQLVWVLSHAERRPAFTSSSRPPIDLKPCFSNSWGSKRVVYTFTTFFMKYLIIYYKTIEKWSRSGPIIIMMLVRKRTFNKLSALWFQHSCIHSPQSFAYGTFPTLVPPPMLSFRFTVNTPSSEIPPTTRGHNTRVPGRY